MMVILKPFNISAIILIQFLVSESDMLFKGSIVKPNGPDETDFLSKTPELIWGILIGAFLVLTAVYFIYRRSKKKNNKLRVRQRYSRLGKKIVYCYD